MGNDQGGSLNGLDHIGNGKGLTRSCHSEEYLMLISSFQPLGQLRNRPRLVALWLKLCGQTKFVAGIYYLIPLLLQGSSIVKVDPLPTSLAA